MNLAPSLAPQLIWSSPLVASSEIPESSPYTPRASVAATESLGVYGELSGASNGEDSDGDNIVDWGAKLGAKFTF